MSSCSSSNYHHHHHHHPHHLPYTVPSKNEYSTNEDGIPPWTGVYPGVTVGEDEGQPGPPKLAPPVGDWLAGHTSRTYPPADALTLRPLLTEGGGGGCAHFPCADPGWLEGESKDVLGGVRARMAGALQKKRRGSVVKTTILCLVLGLAIALAGVLLGVVLLTWTPHRPAATHGCHNGEEVDCDDGGDTLGHSPPPAPSDFQPHPSPPQTHSMSPRPSHLVADCRHVEGGLRGEWCASANGTIDEWVNLTEIDERYGDGEGTGHGGGGGSGRGGSKYKAIFVSDTFMASQDLCRRQGGHLVHVNSMREQIFLEDYVTRLLRLRGQTDRQTISGFWVGARRSRGSHAGTCMFDQWKWIDAYGRTLSFVSGFSAFMPGKPNDQFSPEECLVMSYQEKSPESSYLKWDDVRCDVNVGFKVLCEVEL